MVSEKAEAAGREEFERWWDEHTKPDNTMHSCSLARHEHEADGRPGDYVMSLTAAAWDAWQAGRSAGARAVFDNVLLRAANSYSPNPVVQTCNDTEAKIAIEWVSEGLKEASPDDFAVWKSITEAIEGERKRCLYEINRQKDLLTRISDIKHTAERAWALLKG